MSPKKILTETENFVKGQLANEASGHDWWHIQRVLNNAKLISKTEKVDWFVVAMTVLLHDVGDKKVINKE